MLHVADNLDPVRPETPTPRKMLESLGLLALNSYKPDLAMGLDRNAIDFRRDDNHFQGDICQYIASRGVQVYVGLNESTSMHSSVLHLNTNTPQ
jgi:hypothetical protein